MFHSSKEALLFEHWQHVYQLEACERNGGECVDEEESHSGAGDITERTEHDVHEKGHKHERALEHVDGKQLLVEFSGAAAAKVSRQAVV